MFSTLTLEKAVDLPDGQVPFALLSQVEGNAGLFAVTRISQAAWPGLDYAPEARNAQEYGWGETLLVGWPEPWAVAVVRTVPRQEESAESVALVHALSVHPLAHGQLEEAIRAIHQFAHERKLAQVRLPVNTSDWAALQCLLDCGFYATHVMLRMFLKSGSTPPSGIDLSRWAM